MDKYLGKYRILFIETPSNSDANYSKMMSEFDNYRKQFDALSTMIIKKTSDKFNIRLYGMDGEIKFQTDKYVSLDKIINVINNMQMQQYVISLLNDNKYGYKNKEMALNTLKLIRDEPIKVQFLLVNLLYNKSKNSINLTPKIQDAIQIYKEWLNTYNKK